MIKTYRDCLHYFGGYCELSKNGFGINTTCCERNDCPSMKFQQEEIKSCTLSPLRHKPQKTEKKRGWKKGRKRGKKKKA